MNATQEAKMKRLLDRIAEYMGSDITVESVISMKANIPDDRPDVESIIKRLANNKKSPQSKSKGSDIKFEHSQEIGQSVN